MRNFPNNPNLQFMYLKGFNDGMNKGMELGFVQGVDAMVKQIGTDASERLSNRQNGHLMAYYRELKQKYNDIRRDE